MPVPLRPTAELADRVLLPGDPGRALAVAQALLERPPRMFNHSRGLWGYTGVARDGEPLTVQSTGIGGPSAALVCEQLVALGAKRLVRIGTCRALAPGVAPGSLVAPARVLARDGASAALGAGELLEPDPGLHARLAAAGAAAATLVSTDVLEPREAAGCDVSDLQTAAVLRVAERAGVAAAAVLGVSRGANGSAPLDADQLEELGLRLGEAGYAALASAARSR